jgi:hypothetical protein
VEILSSRVDAVENKILGLEDKIDVSQKWDGEKRGEKAVLMENARALQLH